MLSIQEFQLTLLANGGAIIDNIQKEEVEKYHFIKQNLGESDISKNEEFQQQYMLLYSLQKKRIDAKTIKHFFELLEINKDQPSLNIRELSKEIYGNRPQKYKTKHFTLLTSFIHTIHENYPIYDIQVANLMNDELPDSNDIPFYRKLNIYQEHYENTMGVYKETLENGKLHDLLRALELKFKPFKDSLSQSKNLDLLTRSAGGLKKRGLLINHKSYISP